MWYNSFKVMTDHKPLIHLFTQTSKLPPRIESFSDYPLTSLLYNIDWVNQKLQTTYLKLTLSITRIHITQPRSMFTLLHNCKLPPLY